MANIKGIIVEIGGDTSKLQNALKKVNSSTASLSKELKGINSLLKLDPKNTELLSQKQTVLKENIEQTSKKLEELKKAQEMADRTIAEGGEISEENYRNLQREIINTQNKLNNLKVEASKWTTAGRSIEEFGNKISNISGKLNSIGTTLTTRLTLPITAMATYSVKSFQEVDEGADIVIKKTGAIGDAAKELENIYKKVSSEVVGDFTNIGDAVGEINTRFGFTGDILEDASKKFLEFAKINDTDVNTSVQKVSRYMGDASIEASKYSEVLDQLTSVAQASGISIDTLTEYCTKYGAPMRALGLDTKESIAIFAGWEKAGVNTEIAFSGMKKAISNWGASGKDASKEFKKTLEEIKKAPSIAAATTKAIEIFGAKAGPDLADAIKGGRFEYSEFLNILENSQGIVEKTYGSITDESDDAQVAMKKLKVQFSEVGQEVLKTAVPAIQKILNNVSDLVSKYNKLSEKEKTEIRNMVLLVAAIGPVTKILGTMGKTVGTITKGIGTFSQAVGLMGKTSTTAFKEASTGAQTLAKGLTFLTSPAGLVTAAIAVLAAGIAYLVMKQNDLKESFETLGNSSSEFINGINSANSHLEEFNSTLFTSSEEQQKLQEDMDNVQKGITEICKRASEERRDYTQEEITQLDEYFNKLRELKNRELEIQQSIGKSITQQAEQNAKTFNGNLKEYQAQSQEWIKTAEEQAKKEIGIINERTTQEIALLQQRYGDKATLENEEYAREYNLIQENKDKAIQVANEEVSKVNEAYTTGFLERANQNEIFKESLQKYNSDIEIANQEHSDKLKEIEDNKLLVNMDKQLAIEEENRKHQKALSKIYDTMSKDMSDEQIEELGTLIAMAGQTELYGGQMDEETKTIVNNIIDSYDSMPKDTREAMKNAMQPMLEEMEKKEPSLFSKATGIAEGILSRLKKSFDIHSPSRKTRDIFQNVMKGAELGLQDEEKVLNKQVNGIANKVMDEFNNLSVNKIETPKINDFGKIQGNISSRIIDSTKTVFTTPQIVFNVQELDEPRLQQCFNYINKKFGSAY